MHVVQNIDAHIRSRSPSPAVLLGSVQSAKAIYIYRESLTFRGGGDEQVHVAISQNCVAMRMSGYETKAQASRIGFSSKLSRAGP